MSKLLLQVAFQARLREHFGPSTTKSLILFTKVDINLGHGFDPSNGSFMAVKEGLYVFHLQVMAMADHIAWLELQVNITLQCSNISHKQNVSNSINWNNFLHLFFKTLRPERSILSRR